MPDDLLKHVPKKLHALFAKIVRLTDAFCDVHLNAEYRELCQDLAIAFCQEGSPAVRRKPADWACSIVHAVGWVNFLSDPSQTPPEA